MFYCQRSLGSAFILSRRQLQRRQFFIGNSSKDVTSIFDFAYVWLNLNVIIFQEEDYELGNPKNEKFLTTTSLESKSLAQAAYRKRLLIEEGGPSKRPFIGWKVVIISSTIDGIVHSLMRVVKSGGGEILPYK